MSDAPLRIRRYDRCLSNKFAVSDLPGRRDHGSEDHETVTQCGDGEAVAVASSFVRRGAIRS